MSIATNKEPSRNILRISKIKKFLVFDRLLSFGLFYFQNVLGIMFQFFCFHFIETI